MARDIATLGQAIEQLKASQAQMARDNANAAEQLKASREQMARVLAKASEQNLRPKMSAPPPRPTATPTRRPVPTP
jgi:DNA repair ATPase RecN